MASYHMSHTIWVHNTCKISRGTNKEIRVQKLKCCLTQYMQIIVWQFNSLIFYNSCTDFFPRNTCADYSNVCAEGLETICQDHLV